MKALALVLVLFWAATAISIAAAYRPGGPLDIVVALACFLPVLVAAMAIVWPPVPASDRDRSVIVWIWLAALIFAVPVLYGVASTLATDGPRSLVPSAEGAYAGILALLSMTTFSTAGLVHSRRGVRVFERAATSRTLLSAVASTIAITIAFGVVALINDRSVRREEILTSRYGPTDPELIPPECDLPPTLGENAVVTITAFSSVDNEPRGEARLDGRRGGHDESWGGSWSGPGGSGRIAYRRVARQAWFNPDSDDPEAPGTTWLEVSPNGFGLAGADDLTMDGPPHSVVSGPRGSIVPEDLGLVVIEGARARHCRTFVDGPTALVTFLPLQWLVGAETIESDAGLSDWRGEMDWWVFADGDIGRATVEVSGGRGEVWTQEGVRGVLEAELDATDRTRAIDIQLPAG
jgi:hypothetical protein